ncbi:MAG: hypothetical protein ACM3L9_04315 [Deltaproteobacteria bacterium]
MTRQLALAIALCWPLPAIAGGEITVAPLTLLEDGEVAGCGLTSSSRSPETLALGEVIAFREGEATAFAVRARTVPATVEVTGVRLITASHDTAADFPKARMLGGGLIETRTVLEGFAGSRFAQSLMVTGGRFEITLSDGKTVAYDLPRPMPHAVRQAYLNCAGDLFRPEIEGR